MQRRFWVFAIENAGTEWVVLRESLDDYRTLVAVGGTFPTRAAALKYVDHVIDLAQAAQIRRRPKKL
jgi:hypothetical protein